MKQEPIRISKELFAYVVDVEEEQLYLYPRTVDYKETATTIGIRDADTRISCNVKLTDINTTNKYHLVGDNTPKIVLDKRDDEKVFQLIREKPLDWELNRLQQLLTTMTETPTEFNPYGNEAKLNSDKGLWVYILCTNAKRNGWGGVTKAQYHKYNNKDKYYCVYGSDIRRRVRLFNPDGSEQPIDTTKGWIKGAEANVVEFTWDDIDEVKDLGYILAFVSKERNDEYVYKKFLAYVTKQVNDRLNKHNALIDRIIQKPIKIIDKVTPKPKKVKEEPHAPDEHFCKEYKQWCDCAREDGSCFNESDGMQFCLYGYDWGGYDDDEEEE